MIHSLFLVQRSCQHQRYFPQTTAHLQDNLLVNGKLCDDVGQEQMAAVLAGGVDAGFGQQARPGEGHEAPQLAVARLVVVVNVVRRVFHQQRGELQQADAQRVQQIGLLLWVQHLRRGRRRRRGRLWSEVGWLSVNFSSNLSSNTTTTNDSDYILSAFLFLASSIMHL